ncbi:MAG TPA: FAD-dependent oxidoreductase [Ktedonobacteraceae bacterium]|nr:FAD-dependent oxidoreductase [Ktedonobacteraceae bacterium]
MREQTYDAIVIGAGLGGLLSAAQLLQRKMRVVVLERLPHCGGRFTAKTFQGVQVSTGAVHMAPFGSSGVLAGMLRRLRIPHHFFDADVFGSFHVHGKQYRSRGLLGTFKFLGPRQFFWLIRLGRLLFLRRLPPRERDLPFDAWLARHINTTRNRELVAFFERVSRFSLSLELNQVTTVEVINTTKNMFLHGAPGIVEGGCAALTGELERCLREQGVELCLRNDVLEILNRDGRVTGVRVRDKANDKESKLYAPLVVSDIGPRATNALLNNRQITQAQVLKKQRADPPLVDMLGAIPNSARSSSGSGEEAAFVVAQGLKVHILSDISLIPHKGIMYCLDTKRIAGMVQPTNCDPRLAPTGKHLLISHQVMQSSSIEEEKALALADLRMLFGEAFDLHCRILTMSAYRGEWPVNRLAQGEDVRSETAVQGLFMVGDAVKPPGYLMVEGVAQSVNHFLDLLDTGDASCKHREIAQPPQGHATSSPSRFKAIRWLWEAPGNSRDHYFIE